MCFVTTSDTSKPFPPTNTAFPLLPHTPMAAVTTLISFTSCFTTFQCSDRPLPCCRVPLQLSLPGMLGPRLPALLSRRATSPSAPPYSVLLPGYWAWGMWTPVLPPGQPPALQWIHRKRLRTLKTEHFPSRFAKVAHRIFSYLSEWLFQLALRYQPIQQSLDLTYIFNTTFHLTLLSDLSALQYQG